MKKIGIVILLTGIIMNGFCLKVSAEDRMLEKQGPSAYKNESDKATLSKNRLCTEENDSALNLKTGKRGLAILESLEGPSFNIKKYSEKEEWDQEDNEHERARRRTRFRGHWSGIYSDSVRNNRPCVHPVLSPGQDRPPEL